MEHRKPSDYRNLVKRRLYARPELYIEDVIPQQVYEDQNGICAICDLSLEEAQLSDIDSQLQYRYSYILDHIIPFSLGGDHRRSNVQAVHPACNRFKASIEFKLAALVKRWPEMVGMSNLKWLEMALS